MKGGDEKVLDFLFQIKKEEERIDYGRFSIEPLAAGFGHTLGTALRRVLLTSLDGAAVTKVKIAGVRHRFTTLMGMKEDIVELILNIKKLKVAYSGDKPVNLKLETQGPGEITAKKIKVPAEVKIANPDLILASLSSRRSKLKMEMTAEKGVGYSPFEEREEEKEIGVIPVDALFSPVSRVNYQVVATRVGRLTNLDKLILEIWTNGTVKPSVALKKAAKILVEYFNQLVSPKRLRPKKEPEKGKIPAYIARLSVEELPIPVRVANTLVKGGYSTVGELVKAGRKKIAKVKNVGEKSVKITEAALIEKGVKWSD